MNEDLAHALHQLRGFNEHLDEIADRLEALHAMASSTTLSRDDRQANVARLAGNCEDDLITAVALVAQAFCTIPDGSTDWMDHADRKTAERFGQDIALLLTDPDLHQPAAHAAWQIDPTTH